MHKDFYASGFLYHLPTQQILLQHTASKPDGISLTLFSGKGRKGESAEVTFQRVLFELLQMAIPMKAIHQIYDYPREYGNNHFIQYAEVVAVPSNASFLKKGLAGWYDLKKLSKIKLAEQIRQDIIVGQRVINAVERSRQPQIPLKQYQH